MRNSPPSNTTAPTQASELLAIASGEFKDTGHTEWPDGRVHHTGFTTTLPPNTLVPLTRGGQIFDIDYNSWQEGKDGAAGQPSYASVTSRSFHRGLVQVALLDGAVRAVSEQIDLSVWRALGSRNGGEIVAQP